MHMHILFLTYIHILVCNWCCRWINGMTQHQMSILYCLQVFFSSLVRFIHFQFLSTFTLLTSVTSWSWCAELLRLNRARCSLSWGVVDYVCMMLLITWHSWATVINEKYKFMHHDHESWLIIHSELLDVFMSVVQYGMKRWNSQFSFLCSVVI